MNQRDWRCRARRRAVHRRAMTLLEVAVAAAILAIVLGSSVKMLQSFSNQQRAASQRVVGLQTVQNTMEQLSNRPWDELIAGEVGGLEVPEVVSAYLPAAKLTATIVDEQADIVTRRISVALAWKDPCGRETRPARLVAWVFRDYPAD